MIGESYIFAGNGTWTPPTGCCKIQCDTRPIDGTVILNSYGMRLICNCVNYLNSTSLCTAQAVVNYVYSAGIHSHESYHIHFCVIGSPNCCSSSEFPPGSGCIADEAYNGSCINTSECYAYRSGFLTVDNWPTNTIALSLWTRPPCASSGPSIQERIKIDRRIFELKNSVRSMGKPYCDAIGISL